MKRQCQTTIGPLLAGVAILGMAMSSSAQLTVTNNLQLWLKADSGVQTTGSSVTNWLDQTSNGLNASPDSSSFRPTLVPNALNGLPVVRFDGSDDRLRTVDSAFLDGTSGMTILVVAKPFSLTSPQGMVVKWDYGFHGSYSFEILASSNLRSFVTSGPGDGGLNYRDSTTATPLLSEFRSLALVYDGTQAANADRLQFYRNGVRLADGGGGGTISTTLQDSPSPVTIGDFANLSRHFNGDMAEVLLYNRTLTATERQDVVEYFNAKWAIPEAGTATYCVLAALAGLSVVRRRR